MTNRPLVGVLLVAVLGSAFIPLVAAHGAVNSREVEVLVLKDELSDVQTSLAGYDLGEFYVAEAWIPGLGDGFYFHTILFGAFPGNPPAGEYKVVFTIDDGSDSPIRRTIATTDGKELSTDFDLLEATPEEDQVEIDRAFIRFDGTSLARGSTIKTFVVESFADGELRDRAPGSIYAPRSGGRVELPAQGSSIQAVPSLLLEGPIKYANATFATTTEPDVFTVNITSRLAEGAQHVHLETPEWALEDPMFSGWTFEILGSAGGEIPANGSTEVRFRLIPTPDENGLVLPQMINVTTDIGGRLGFQIRLGEDGDVSFVSEHGASSWAPTVLAKPQAESPSPALPLLLLVAALAVAVARRRMS